MDEDPEWQPRLLQQSLRLGDLGQGAPERREQLPMRQNIKRNIYSGSLDSCLVLHHLILIVAVCFINYFTIVDTDSPSVFFYKCVWRQINDLFIYYLFI